jgi:hypothetical protein
VESFEKNGKILYNAFLWCYQYLAKGVNLYAFISQFYARQEMIYGKSNNKFWIQSKTILKHKIEIHATEFNNV